MNSRIGTGIFARQRPVVLDQALQRFPCQVKAVEFGVAALQPRDDAQRLGIVVEPAPRPHHVIERILAGVTERGVAEIVGERQRFGQVLVDAQGARQGACDLGDLDGVRQAGAVVIAFVIDENLGLVLQAAKCGRMDDAVAVALERRPRRAGGLGCNRRPRLSPA